MQTLVIHPLAADCRTRRGLLILHADTSEPSERKLVGFGHVRESRGRKHEHRVGRTARDRDDNSIWHAEPRQDLGRPEKSSWVTSG